MIRDPVNLDRHSVEATNDSTEIGMQIWFQLSSNQRRAFFGCKDDVVEQIRI